MEVFLPWPSFNKTHNGHKYAVAVPKEITQKCIHLVGKLHPNPRGLSNSALLMHARNVQILLGRDLKEHVKFVMYWNPIGKTTGGTVMALKIADLYSIPKFNLASKEDYDTFVKYLKFEEKKWDQQS